jgi:ribokinase
MKKKPKILVVGSFVMDLIVRAPRFVGPGETILGTDFNTASGGKGANQAMQAALLGADVTMMGCVGQDDFGDRMLASLKKANVDVSHVLRADNVSSAVGNVQIAQGADGTQNRIVVVPGANMRTTPQDVAFLKDGVSDYDMVLLQLEIPMEINELIAGYAFARGVPVMLNPAPSAPLSAELLSHLTYLSPNENEASDLAGIPVTDEASANRAADVLRAKGVRKVLITRGAAGSYYADEKETIVCPCVRCDHVADPTAAGDSFVGAFSFAVCAGLSVKDALTFAAYTASITVSRMGAQPSLPSLAQVLAFMRARGAALNGIDD